MAALALKRLGVTAFHGYKLASQLRMMHHTTRAMSYSTLYRCLDRLSDRGYVTWEWVEDLEKSKGPKRREYTLSDAGEKLASSLAAEGGEDSELFWNLA